MGAGVKRPGDRGPGDRRTRSSCSRLPSPVSRPSRTVIFTADDFGLSAALNGAVALAHRRGLLRCASLMAAAPETEAAFRLARELPGLCLGVHLTLIQGRAVLPPEKIPHLVDTQGRFHNHPVTTGWRYFWQPRLLPEIKRELAAQIEAVLQADLTPWHLNGHVNLHLHPRIFPLVLELAREYGIPAAAPALGRLAHHPGPGPGPSPPQGGAGAHLRLALPPGPAADQGRRAHLQRPAFRAVKRRPHDRRVSPRVGQEAAARGH